MTGGLALRSADGRAQDASAWLHVADPIDTRVLHDLDGPVLDVGCGPGRHVVALAERGVVTLGIDVALVALSVARMRGAPALERSIFARVPGAGRWRTALLLDGNVGIGGDPEALLHRIRELLAPRGMVVLEADPARSPDIARTVRLEIKGRAGPWFELAHVAVDEIACLADVAGFSVARQWTDGGRHFAHLRAP
jgi:SAM-dependent methyltransferase